MTDDAPTGANHPDRVFIWLDEDGVRCGPRHRTLKTALNFLQNRDFYWVKDEDTQQARTFERDLSQYPSQKQPKKLVVGEWITRDLTKAEEDQVEQVKKLIKEGLI